MSKTTGIQLSESKPPVVAFTVGLGTSTIFGVIREYLLSPSKYKKIDELIEYEDMPSTDTDIYVDAQSASRLSNVSVQTIYSWCHSKKIIAYQEGGKNGKWWIKELSLKNHLEKSKAKAKKKGK